MVKANWTEDYYNSQPSPGGPEHPLSGFDPVSPSSGFRRRRVPFVPFALRNATGAALAFCTQTRMSGATFVAGGVGNQRAAGSSAAPSGPESGGGGCSKWRSVEPGDTVPFTFEERAKLRHMNSHDMKIHQV